MRTVLLVSAAWLAVGCLWVFLLSRRLAEATSAPAAAAPSAPADPAPCRCGAKSARPQLEAVEVERNGAPVP